MAGIFGNYFGGKVAKASLGQRAESVFNNAMRRGKNIAGVAGPAAAALAGIGVGTVAAVGGMALGASYLGYRALRGRSDSLHGRLGPNAMQIRPNAQVALLTAAGVGSAGYGIMGNHKKAWTTDISHNGNLESTTPAQFNATGDLVLSQRKRYSKK
jgi:hypothetical protein